MVGVFEEGSNEKGEAPFKRNLVFTKKERHKELNSGQLIIAGKLILTMKFCFCSPGKKGQTSINQF